MNSEFKDLIISRHCSKDHLAPIQAEAFDGLKVRELRFDTSFLPLSISADFFQGIQGVYYLQIAPPWSCWENVRLPVYSSDAFQSLSTVVSLTIPIHYTLASKVMFSHLPNVKWLDLSGAGLELLEAKDLQKLTQLEQVQIWDHFRDLNPDLQKGMELLNFHCSSEEKLLRCLKK